MSIWRYKWVSAVLAGEPDTAAMTKAAGRGWEPCPVYAVPAGIEEPVGADGVRGNFKLYRMAEDKVRAIEEDRAAFNAWIARPETHVEEANRAIREFAGTLDGGEKALEQWSPIQGAGSVSDGYRMEPVPKTRFWRA